ncbi:DUF2637 domain-containing protein [Rhodococcus sp. BS-15]|uniref:DUF2637 domain-containing protein n=1 Tax=Rhodococcus sp. BS-15 TaxID=1304954 RepID=UPI000AD0B032|nr:DUF2637 domain-containing protein [Rhodococcus sp. BS-15]
MFTRIFALLITSCACAGAFLLSFYALSDLAADYGVPEEHAWVWALVVDLSILGGTTARLKMRESNFARMIFICATAVSVAGNTVHALPYGPVGIGIAIFPPLAVLGLFEVCVKLLQNVNAPAADAGNRDPAIPNVAIAAGDGSSSPQASGGGTPINTPVDLTPVTTADGPVATTAVTPAVTTAAGRPGAVPEVPVWLPKGAPVPDLTHDWQNKAKTRPSRRSRPKAEQQQIPETV